MIEAIVLAAGLGTRIGRIKPLIEIQGEPALCIILRKLRDAGIVRPIVVLGHAAGTVRDVVDLSQTHVVINLKPEQGMASSLALGLRMVNETAPGALVLHADMPFVEASTIHAVLDAARNGARMAAPTYDGQRGFPVYFARVHFAELLGSLEGDTGARAYLAHHASDLALVAVDDDGCLRDIDTPDDIPRAMEKLHALHADR